ncbi:MAG: glycosyltransferase [Anaerolineae bacterium]|nr:glycosyltransferase [Anaerolineae bacterium]
MSHKEQLRQTRILQLNSAAEGGGAAKVAYSLHRAYRTLGLNAWLAVGKPGTANADPHIYTIDNRRRGNPLWVTRGILQRLCGWQDISYPGSHRLARAMAGGWDIVHAHNLHGYYFDMGALPAMARYGPIIVTMHDQWLMTGHCAYTLGCQRWSIGCGHCPDLDVYQSIRHDGTRFNWQRKQRLLEQADVFVTSPAQWLLDQLDNSLLAARPRRLIVNGIDTTVFTPGDQALVRQELSLPTDRYVLLFVANPANDFKDFATLLRAVGVLQETTASDKRPFLLVLGSKQSGQAVSQRYRDEDMRLIPFITDEEEVARYYQAADILVHAAKAEVLPLAILEAMACGCAVIASDVGGIAEEIVQGETGFVVPPGDPSAIAAAITALMNDPERITLMGQAGQARVRQHFTLDRMASAYLDLYTELRTDWHNRTAQP